MNLKAPIACLAALSVARVSFASATFELGEIAGWTEGATMTARDFGEQGGTNLLMSGSALGDISSPPGDISWAPGEFDFTITLDRSSPTHTLVYSFKEATSGSAEYTFSAVVDDSWTFNALEMTVSDDDADGSYIEISDLALDDVAITEGDNGDGSYSTDGASATWGLRDGTLDDGFVLTGTLTVVGYAFGANGHTMFAMVMGNDPAFAQNPLPAPALMAALGLLGVAGSRRRRRIT